MLWFPPTPKLKASVSVSVAFQGSTGPATTVAGIVIPSTDIITTTDVFTIVLHIILLTTTAAIIDAIIGKTMIDRCVSNDFATTTSARAKKLFLFCFALLDWCGAVVLNISADLSGDRNWI